MLKISWNNPEQVPESNLDKRSSGWMVMVNGRIIDAGMLPLEVQIEYAAGGLIPCVRR